MKAQRKDAVELATFQAYQAVRIHWMTKSKKGRMPKFQTLLGKDGHTINESTDPKKARAMLEMVAARAGTRVRPMKRDRIVRGV